ncbi:MAG: efflux transporter outer membrane subunit, partial [Bilophila sp.]
VHPSLLVVINAVRFLGIGINMGILAPFSANLNIWYLSRLASQATDASLAMTSTMNHWTSLFLDKGSTAATAHHNSLAMVASSIKKQASIFSYNHIFLYLALIACIGFCCLILCRRQGSRPVYSLVVHRCAVSYKHIKRTLLLPHGEPSWWGWKRGTRVGLLFLSLGLLPGCSLGPDYQRPVTALPQQSLEQDIAGKPYTESTWWELFQDETLNALEAEALRRNTNLAQAMARVAEAAAKAGISFADRLPSAGLSASTSTRQITEGEKAVHQYPERVQDAYATSGFVRFELDLWGKYRRLDEAAQAELLGTQAARDTVRLSLTAEVALSYVQLRTLQEQMRIAAAMLETYAKTCKVYETRYRLGQSPETTYRRFAAERSKTMTMLTNLEEKVSQCEGTLAVLVGFDPAEIVQRIPTAFSKGKSLTQLNLPPLVPVALPSTLLQRRPDVRSVEGQLMAANARIGAAKASFFPTLTLTTDQGFASSKLDNLITDPARVWSVMGGLSQPLFQGGRLQSQYRMTKAQYDVVLAAYQGSVQNAFKETRDALVSNALSRDMVRSSAEQVAALTRSNVLMEKQYNAGLASVMDVLDVRRQLLASQQELAESHRRQLAGVVQLCRALGGGWTETTVSATP